MKKQHSVAIKLILFFLFGGLFFLLGRRQGVRGAAISPYPGEPVSKKSPPLVGFRGPVRSQPFALKEKACADLYVSNQKLKAQYTRLLGDVSDVYLFARGWTEAPLEFVEPFRYKLQETLGSQNMVEFVPVVGQSAPEGCQKEPAGALAEGAAGAVVEVLEIGIKHKDQPWVIKKPVVRVVPESDG
jgi:hypothetical protein